MVGMAGAPAACADTTDDVIGQAVTDLNQANAVLDAAPTADLNTQQADFLLFAQDANQDSFLEQIGAQQDLASASDQTFLAGADEQLVTAAQSVLSADQAFVTADQAGDLSSTGFNSVDLAVLESDFGLGGAELNVIGDSILAAFDPNIGTDAAASAATAAVTDPATLLSEATTNYTDANQLLGDIPSGDFASVTSTIDTQDTLLQTLGFVDSAESSLSSYDGGALADLLNPWFSIVDQGWYSASEAALNADQALETAVASGSATAESTALLGLITPSFDALAPDLNSVTIILADLLTGNDPISAGGDLASGLDTSIFADVLSSIGF